MPALQGGKVAVAPHLLRHGQSFGVRSAQEADMSPGVAVVVDRDERYVCFCIASPMGQPVAPRCEGAKPGNGRSQPKPAIGRQTRCASSSARQLGSGAPPRPW
jgi:hypothetical protein